MLKIRPAQVAAFAEAERRAFVDAMLSHLEQFAPTHAETVGDRALLALIHLGLERSTRYHLTNRGPIRFYIELMCMLGADFDTDPLLPWAADVLGQGAEGDQDSRMERLYERVMDFRERVFGPDYAFERAAVRRLRTAHFQDLPSLGRAFDDECFRRSMEVYPEKARFVGRDAFVALLRHAAATAAQRSLPGSAGVALVAGLMFALGHGCLVDPQFPWLTEAFEGTAADDAELRTKQLLAGFTTYLRSGRAPVPRG